MSDPRDLDGAIDFAIRCFMGKDLAKVTRKRCIQTLLEFKPFAPATQALLNRAVGYNRRHDESP